jgi:hypothetical protein
MAQLAREAQIMGREVERLHHGPSGSSHDPPRGRQPPGKAVSGAPIAQPCPTPDRPLLGGQERRSGGA